MGWKLIRVMGHLSAVRRYLARKKAMEGKKISNVPRTRPPKPNAPRGYEYEWEDKSDWNIK